MKKKTAQKINKLKKLRDDVEKAPMQEAAKLAGLAVTLKNDLDGLLKKRGSILIAKETEAGEFCLEKFEEE